MIGGEYSSGYGIMQLKLNCWLPERPSQIPID